MAAALLLLAVVGVASRAEVGGGEALSTSGLAAAAMLLAVAGAVVLGIGTLALGGGYAGFVENRRKLVIALVITALLAGFIALVLAPIDAEIELKPVPRSQERAPIDGGSSADANTFPLIAAIVLGAVAIVGAVLLALAAVGIVKRRRQAPQASGEEEEVMQALEESLDDLRRERDVRRAIIACYARMERALERAGSTRRPAEAPLEYLVRVLERVTANGRAARALTDLFERAKFSVEPMGERDKEQAIEALELLRAEVSSTP